MGEAFLLLGSNLGNRLATINQAVDKIQSTAGVVKCRSSVYETEPWGTDEPLPFLNLVIGIETTLNPIPLLESLMKIESELGRKRDGIKNQPRTIDIDILLFGDLIMKTEYLTIPHERMHLRKFVLVPMSEIAPDLKHPVMNKSMRQLMDECKDSSWVRKFEK